MKLDPPAIHWFLTSNEQPSCQFHAYRGPIQKRAFRGRELNQPSFDRATTVTRMASGKYLYRITRLEHLISVFKQRCLHLVAPASWDDPYESKLNDPVFERVFAQSWSTVPTSDAMWRIYSPHHLGVRIRVLRSVLLNEVSRGLPQQWNIKLANVEYMKAREIAASLYQSASELRSEFDPLKALDTLFWKRDAFEHENEVRLVIYAPTVASGQTFIEVAVNPHDLIQDIMIDPRAPDELLDVSRFYLRAKLKFRGGVRKSVLYSPIQAIRARRETTD